MGPPCCVPLKASPLWAGFCSSVTPPFRPKQPRWDRQFPSLRTTDALAQEPGKKAVPPSSTTVLWFVTEMSVLVSCRTNLVLCGHAAWGPAGLPRNWGSLPSGHRRTDLVISWFPHSFLCRSLPEEPCKCLRDAQLVRRGGEGSSLPPRCWAERLLLDHDR